ncbi:MAG: glycerol-3-phosphate 1-O-acyltransferase PlsY [Sphingobium sp.]
METSIWIGPAAALLLGYLLGSIPFGLILTRISGAGDLRAIGSGNIGATNVLRTGRKWLAALTLILDMAKGTAAVLIAAAVSPEFAPLAAVGAFLGHVYPVWLRFRGGKGVATLFGIALAFSILTGSPFYALVFAAVWIGTILITRISSLGGMSAAILLPVTAAVLGRFDLVVLFMALTLILLWKHRGNVERLMAGTEPRIGRA